MRNNAVRVVSLVFVVAVFFGLVACSREKKMVTYDDGIGLTVTMQEGMKPFEAEGFVMAYANDDCMMSALREGFDEYSAYGLELDTMTVEEYAELTVDANALEGLFAPDVNGNQGITYTATVDGREYFYYSIVCKGPDAFWLVTFACFEDMKEEYLDRFILWSGTVTVE